MKSIKTIPLVVSACTLVTLVASEAAAQTPVLNVSANGSSVTIEWNSVPGALAYNIQVGSEAGAGNIGAVTLPASITRIVVNAPNGTYFLRVRSLGITGFGPFSNEANVTVPTSPPPGPAPGPSPGPSPPNPPPCDAPAADGG